MDRNRPTVPTIRNDTIHSINGPTLGLQPKSTVHCKRNQRSMEESLLQKDEKNMKIQEAYLQIIDPNIWKCGKTPSRATTRPGRAQPLSSTRSHPGTEGQLLEVDRVSRKQTEPSEGVSPIGTSAGAQPGAAAEASSRSRVTIRPIYLFFSAYTS